MASFLQFLENGRSALGGRLRAVEDSNDDDHCNQIGSGKLGIIQEFGYTAEAVRSRAGNRSFSGLLGIKLELDFCCRLHQRSQIIDNNLSIQKRSIDGT
jgi:hypothetical protein